MISLKENELLWRLLHNAGPQRWADAVADLLALQAEYAAWYEGLPDNLRDNPTGEALETIVDLDLDALTAIVPPRGYGRD